MELARFVNGKTSMYEYFQDCSGRSLALYAKARKKQRSTLTLHAPIHPEERASSCAVHALIPPVCIDA